MSFLIALTKGGAVMGLIFLIVALLKQLIVVAGFLIALVKLAIIVAFVGMLVMIGLAIYRDRCRRRDETSRA